MDRSEKMDRPSFGPGFQIGPGPTKGLGGFEISFEISEGVAGDL